MPQPLITPLDVNSGDSIFDAQTAINTLIDQSIKDVSMNGGQELLIETQDGSNIQVPVPSARDGILSGMVFSFTGPLAADVTAGNFQVNGLTNSFGITTSIGFAARHATLPRIDIVYADVAAPAISILAGTPNLLPLVPDLSAVPGDNAPLHYVWIDPATAASPRDFILHSAEVNPRVPTQLGKRFVNNRVENNLPETVKCIDFNPLIPRFDARVIKVDCSLGPVTVQLPLPADNDECQWEFVDSTGNAAANNITIDAATTGLTTVNGAASITINTNYGQRVVTCTGGEFYAR